MIFLNIFGITLFLTYSPLMISSSVETGGIYTIDSLDNESENYSLTIAENKSASLDVFSISQPNQRFTARITTGTTFNLFLEVQPWDWVNYIVESSKTVNIKDKTPQVLDAVLQNVVQNDYNGQNSQKWYVVQTGSDPNVGRIVNMLTKFCLISNGKSAPATTGICDSNDTRQLWKLTLRNQGRCY